MRATNTPTGVLGTLFNWAGGGAREERVETVSGYKCRVHTASNVHMISRTISLDTRKWWQVDPPLDGDTSPLSESEYLSPDAVRIVGRDVGRPRHVLHKSDKFTGHLWLCCDQDFPLNLKVCVCGCGRRRAHLLSRSF